jgi:putative transposase
MPRKRRQDIVRAGNYYHVIARGNNRRDIFRSSDDYDYYRCRLLKAKRLCAVSLFHYVLMPNHIHLLVSPSTDDLGVFMHRVQMPFAKRYCRINSYVGHVWQGRFKSLLVDSDAYLYACGNYIEMNPVRAGLVASPEGWQYSSYGYYGAGADDQLVDEDPFFAGLAKTKRQRRINYRKLVVGID